MERISMRSAVQAFRERAKNSGVAFAKELGCMQPDPRPGSQEAEVSKSRYRRK
jgi:hypothetical protein